MQRPEWDGSSFTRGEMPIPRAHPFGTGNRNATNDLDRLSHCPTPKGRDMGQNEWMRDGSGYRQRYSNPPKRLRAPTPPIDVPRNRVMARDAATFGKARGNDAFQS